MEPTNRILDLLDKWRHLPDYQLERRADVFFAAYLPEYLSFRQRLDIRSPLIPEFPIKQSGSHRSDKVDYLAVDATAKHAFFIELKTDRSSRRDKQDKYLENAKKQGLQTLLQDLLQIVCASEHKHKYCSLLRLLEENSLIKLPHNLDAALESARFKSAVNACIPNVQITAPESPIEVLFLQPVAQLPDEIGFDEFASWLETRGDAFASRFAGSLRNWAAVRAGR